MNNVDEHRIQLLQRNLANIRKAAGWTTQRMADEIGVSRQTISNIENGRQKLSKTQYLALRAVLNVEIANESNAPLAQIVQILVDKPAEQEHGDGDDDGTARQDSMNAMSSATSLLAQTIDSDPKKNAKALGLGALVLSNPIALGVSLGAIGASVVSKLKEEKS